MRLFPLPFLFSLSSWCSFCLFACYIVTPSSLFLTEYLPPLFVLLLVLVLALLLLLFSFSSSSYFSQLSEDCWKKYVDFTRLKLKYQEFLAKPPGSFGSIECWELPAIIFDIFAGLGIKCLDFFYFVSLFSPTPLSQYPGQLGISAIHAACPNIYGFKHFQKGFTYRSPR